MNQTTSSPILTIVIPTWNHLLHLQTCVASIRRNTQLPYQLVVHVNDGSDGTLDWVRRQRIEHTWTPVNVGICRGMNIASCESRTEYLVYVNDDMYVLPNWDLTLYAAVSQYGESKPCFASGTMIQAVPNNPASITGYYGCHPDVFEEARLLKDLSTAAFTFDDWCGATWPPCCIHLKWWRLVGGYSLDFSPGFYSDIDFSAKLWSIGCRDYFGIGSSLVYHFGETSTSLMRGKRSANVKRARAHFREKWGTTPSSFTKYYLRAGRPMHTRLSGPNWWERTLDQIRGRRLRPTPGVTNYSWEPLPMGSSQHNLDVFSTEQGTYRRSAEFCPHAASAIN